MEIFRLLLRWFSLTVLAALIGAALATLIADFFWFFDLFSHFRAQYVVAAIAVAILLFWLRPRSAALVALLLAGWHSYIYFDVPKARHADSCADTIHLMTFNLQYRNREKAAAIDALSLARVDILVLEENWQDWAPHLDRLGDEYPHAAPEDWRDADGPTILSRFPIVDARIVRPFESASLDVDPARSAFAAAMWYLVARIEIREGGATVIAVHAPYPNGTFLTGLRNAYLEDVATLARAIDGPVIVAGDFNTTPWSPAFDPLFETAGLMSAGLPLMTWPSWFPPAGIPIDHVLVNDRISSFGAGRGPDLGSDHLPVLASLCIDGGIR
ncbi:MAG: endonuclease/exonuclease/phosphatase family protein [Dongiaceae bacterium]